MVVTTAAASRITRTGVPYFCHFDVGGGAGACSCCAADMGAGVVTGDVKTGFSIVDMAPLNRNSILALGQGKLRRNLQIDYRADAAV